MKIFIPFKISDIGGTSTFAAIFSKELKKRGFEICFDFDSNYDILFAISTCPLKYIIDAKVRNKKIIQRLDGVYNPAANGAFYFLLNLSMKIIHNWFADIVIYQSNFSKLSCEKFFGKPKNNYTVIYNGVEINQFAQNTINKNTDKIKLITFGKFRREDQLRPITEVVKKMPIEFHLDIYGSHSHNLSPFFSEIENYSNITWQGKLSHSEMLKKLPEYDILLFSDQSACPNGVLESLAAGLPVVAYDRGSIEEIIKSGYNGEVIKLSKHNPFYDSFPFSENDYENFRDSIIKISSNLKIYKERSLRDAATRFSINQTMEQYIKQLNARLY